MTRAVVVGAGLSGLAAARELSSSGVDTVVIDKGRSVGGRLATRRIGGARLDHGAQFFTTRSDEFTQIVSSWVDKGVAHEWCRGFGSGDGFPRYVGTNGMTTVAKHLAEGLNVRCNTLAFSIARVDGAWVLTTDDGNVFEAELLVLTCPIPQSFSLLFTAGIEVPPDLRSIEYDRTIALLATLSTNDHAVAFPGGVQFPDEVFSFIADNQVKGVSERPALTFHANPSWSLNHFDAPVEELAQLLLSAAAPHIGRAEVLEHQVKKWRFAIPRTVWPEPCWIDETGTLALAGDAFAGPRVEGAVLSGLAASRALTR